MSASALNPSHPVRVTPVTSVHVVAFLFIVPSHPLGNVSHTSITPTILLFMGISMHTIQSGVKFL
jgi:hypothetical protein